MAETFDLVIANHMLFYCEDLSQTCREVARVLKKSGRFICSTYGKKHMKEVSELAKGFDNRIVLSADNLYEKFGKENGKEILKPYFHEISWQEYKDKLEIQDAEPLIAYILSCHGNQNQYILSRYQEFRDYVKQKAGKGYDVTKEAGIFVCRK
jgi:ubiquinone/menaquinone biosynthesis C-methylase UbiE